LVVSVFTLGGYSRARGQIFDASTKLRVNIFSNKKPNRLEMSVVEGHYQIYDKNGEVLAIVTAGDVLNIEKKDSNIVLYYNEFMILKEKFLLLKSSNDTSVLSIKNLPSEKSYAYDGDLEVSLNNGNLMLINIIDLEKYVAGVVKSEVGNMSDSLQFYEVQAIIVRTFALKNIRKHEQEGFHLCDGVHCQAYDGKNVSRRINIAVKSTQSMVLTDSSGNLISTNFFSNSGGMTVNSEDYWIAKIPYLRAVEDPFSLKGRNCFWSKTYSISDWLHLLQKHFDYDIYSSTSKNKALEFEQKTRQVYFADSDIKLKDIREKLGLNSTFFSVKKKGNNVILEGRGFGHGVGLSQEGACEMIHQGYSVEDVLKFYYQGVIIRTVN
jgi:stage II sporulation protein D